VSTFGFEWDDEKARSNVRKHGISFEEAATIFADWLHITRPDPQHSTNEERFVTIGMSTRNRLLVVAHAYPGDVIRIINARPATRLEKQTYEEK
jgi:uncharacterized DUF497 family protein